MPESQKDTNRKDIYGPFVKGVEFVLQTSLEAVPQWGRPSVADSYPLRVGHVVSHIGIVGQLQGAMALCMEEAAAVNLAAISNRDAQFTRVNKEVESLLREIINMAAGNAINRLGKMGVVCDITTPRVITGRNMDIHCTPAVRTVILPVMLNGDTSHLYLTLAPKSGSGIEYKIY